MTKMDYKEKYECGLKSNFHLWTIKDAKDGEKELKKISPKTLDPDKVIEWLEDQACQGWIEDIEVEKFVDKFKKDFGL